MRSIARALEGAFMRDQETETDEWARLSGWGWSPLRTTKNTRRTNDVEQERDSGDS